MHVCQRGKDQQLSWREPSDIDGDHHKPFTIDELYLCALTAGGEAPHAFVVLKQGARADERELREFARAKPRALQSAAQRDLRQRVTKNCDRQIQKYILRANRLRSLHSE